MERGLAEDPAIATANPLALVASEAGDHEAGKPACDGAVEVAPVDARSGDSETFTGAG